METSIYETRNSKKWLFTDYNVFDPNVTSVVKTLPSADFHECVKNRAENHYCVITGALEDGNAAYIIPRYKGDVVRSCLRARVTHCLHQGVYQRLIRKVKTRTCNSSNELQRE